MKTFLISAILLFGLSTTAFSQLRFGIDGGVSFSNTNIKSTSGGLSLSPNTNTLTSFHIGILAEAPLGNKFYLQPQLQLAGQGFKLKNYMGSNFNETVNPFYLELPVNIIYKIPVGPGKAFAGLGPYLAIGLFGKAKGKGTYAGEKIDSTKNIRFGSSAQKDDFTSLDDGLNFKGGYEFDNGFLITVNYSLGLKNTVPDPPSGASRRNYYVGISIGYLLGKK